MRSPAPRRAAPDANPQLGRAAPRTALALARAAERAEAGGGWLVLLTNDAPQGGRGRDVPSCTPLTVPPPICAQRMIRDATGNTKYEFGDGSKAIADSSKDAAEKVREALGAW